MGGELDEMGQPASKKSRKHKDKLQEEQHDEESQKATKRAMPKGNKETCEGKKNLKSKGADKSMNEHLEGTERLGSGNDAAASNAANRLVLRESLTLYQATHEFALHEDGQVSSSIESARFDGGSFQENQPPPYGKKRPVEDRQGKLQTNNVLQVFDIGGDTDAEDGPASENDTQPKNF